MLNFYPGPSKLYNGIEQHMHEALESGILTMNHRSKEFMTLYAQVQRTFETYYSLPKGYLVFFTSSATECWEIIADSFHGNSFLSIYNGAFGKKWAEVNEKLGNRVQSKVFDIHSEPRFNYSEEELHSDIVCSTLVETSNGTFISSDVMNEMRQTFPNALIAVDATSGMAGLEIDWHHGDIWFASVQKCFGLPSGMAVMILSPKAINKVQYKSWDKHYNSLKRIVDNGEHLQTTNTPNILGIYLLNKHAEYLAENKPFQKLEERMDRLYNHFIHHPDLRPLIVERNVQSPTILTLKGDENYILRIKKELKEHDIIIGNGYGIWKSDTVRIANFPAHTDEDFDRLLNLL
jgi:phosphoserine aminotransferase